MSDFIRLDASKRTIKGKQVKQLRNQGLVPAVVYGPEVEPLTLSIDKGDLRQVLMEAGGTQIIELHVDGDTIPTLAREVQRDPILGEMMHIDFYRVSMNRPIRAEVPIILEGENPMVITGAAVLVQGLNSLTVEALPASLPPQIEIDITQLEEIGDQLLVGDLSLPEGSRAISDETDLIVKLDYPRMIEEEEEEEEEELFFEETPEVEVIREARDEEEDFED